MAESILGLLFVVIFLSALLFSKTFLRNVGCGSMFLMSAGGIGLCLMVGGTVGSGMPLILVVVLSVLFWGSVAVAVAGLLRFVSILIGGVRESVGNTVKLATGSEIAGDVAKIGFSIGLASVVADSLEVEGGANEADLVGPPDPIEPQVVGISTPPEPMVANPMPDPSAYGLPSVVDGDPRILPVSGYERTATDGGIEVIKPYWRGKPN
jgi:hypothetical protein